MLFGRTSKKIKWLCNNLEAACSSQTREETPHILLGIKDKKKKEPKKPPSFEQSVS